MTDLEQSGFHGAGLQGSGPEMSRRGFLGGTAGLTFVVAYGA